jgi:hypothetical protein
MADRLRVLLDRPLDPSAARALLILASAILVGFAALFALAATEPGSPPVSTGEPTVGSGPGRTVPVGASRHRPPRSMRHQDDPQDVPGSAAARQAARALRSHRALQHVPYRNGELRVDLIGARGSRAVLRVSASTERAARRGWHRFLRRYRDPGQAYVPVLRASSSTRGGS